MNNSHYAVEMEDPRELDRGDSVMWNRSSTSVLSVERSPTLTIVRTIAGTLSVPVPQRLAVVRVRKEIIP